MLTVLAVSDGTGETAERMVRAALAQFPDAAVEIVRHGGIRTPEQVQAIVREAAAGGALVLHTLVSHDLRRWMLSEARRMGVDALDMMGPPLDRLATHLRLTPTEQPGLFHQLTEARAREIEAVEFAFRHDDGQNPQGLHRAEVVLTGVSRTMKTPTMLYLAYRGWFAANVPLVPDLPVPSALASLPAGQVFCLFMAPLRLQELRRVRADLEAIPVEVYATMEQVRRELIFAERACQTYGWRKIDVTGKSVEELGREIIAMLQ